MADSIRIRIVTPDSIRIRFKRKWPIRRSLLALLLYYTNTHHLYNMVTYCKCRQIHTKTDFLALE